MEAVAADATYASVSDIARAEKLDRTYVGDVLRLTLLAPKIVEAIVEGGQSGGVTLPRLMEGVAVGWAAQARDMTEGPTAGVDK